MLKSQLLGCLLSLAFTFIQGISRGTWKPQYGTVEFPRDPIHSPTVRRGQIYNIDGTLLRARQECSFNPKPNQPQCDISDNSSWQKLRSGSYLLPKKFKNDQVFFTGDLFTADGKILKADVDGIVNNDQYQRTTSFHEVNVKAEWMTLSAEFIGNEHLGDLAIAGSHDSGTAGCNADSFLVDRNFLFQIAERLEPQIVANWSKTQDLRLGGQLELGFREFDMRIADMEDEDGTFRWCHGITGYTIEGDLDQIASFAAQNPNEVITLSFGHFAKPGNAQSATLPIPEYRKDMIADILVEKLEPYMAVRGNLGNNPTVNEILSTGGNIIVIMKDSYIRGKHPGFWEDVIHSAWSGRANPEDLFEERSSKLRGFKDNYSNRMTHLSGCNTPNENIVIGGLIKKYGDNPNITEIIEEILPGLLEIDPRLMSFEGLWYDLVLMAKEGVNTAGMWARPPNFYGSGASVHYRGVNKMMPHWLARPQLYKLNHLGVDDVESSTIVDTAIKANLGQIPLEVTICHQGNSLDGYYEWDSGIHALRGNESLDCDTGYARYQVESLTYGIGWYNARNIASKTCVTFQEGQYPPDATVTINASIDGNSWEHLYKGNIQEIISGNKDVYIRAGNKKGQQIGYGYISLYYDDFGNTCDVPPEAKLINRIYW